MSSNLETRSLLDEIRGFDKGCLFDLGHPLLNCIAESFIKAAGVLISISLSLIRVLHLFQIGAVQAFSGEAYFIAIEGTDSNGAPVITGSKKQRLPELKGETNRRSLEAMVKLKSWLKTSHTLAVSSGVGNKSSSSPATVELKTRDAGRCDLF